MRWRESDWFECGSCHGCWVGKLSFADPRDFYAETYYSDELGRLSNEWWDFDQGAQTQFRWILKEAKKRVAHGRWLDIGCGGGFFLKLCREAGYEVAGLELARQAREKASKVLSLEIEREPVEDCAFAPGSFDVVSMNNVLEHIPEPLKTLREVHRILRSGGLLTISVPNANFGRFVLTWLTPFAQVLRRADPIYSLAVFDADMHAYAFSPGALQRFATKAGFLEIELFNEVPVFNCKRRVRNFTKRVQYRASVALRTVLGPRCLTGHGITAFARKP